MGTFEQDEGTEIVLDSGELEAADGWTLLSGTINRTGPEVMVHLEFAHDAGAPAEALQLQHHNFWPNEDTHTADGSFVIKAGAVLAVHHVDTSGVPGGGSASVTYADKNPITVAFDESATGLQTLLDNIFGAGNTHVTGGPLPTELVITFQGELSGQVIAAPTVDDSGLTGGTDPHLTVTSSVEGESAGSIEYLGDTSSADSGPIVCETVYDPFSRG